MRIPHEQPRRRGAHGGRDAALRADAGLQATVTPLGAQVGPLLHISNRAAGDTRWPAHPGPFRHRTPSARCTKPCRTEGDRLYGPGGWRHEGGIYLPFRRCATWSPQAPPRCRWTFWWCLTKKPGNHASRPHIEAFARNARYGLVVRALRPRQRRQSASPRARAQACCAWA